MAGRSRAVACAAAICVVGLIGAGTGNRAGAASLATAVGSGAPVTGFQQDAAHDGDASGDDLAANPKLTWHAETDGAVTYPVVADGTVFIAFQARNSSYQPTAPGQVEALDEATGTAQWSSQVPGHSPTLAWDGKSLFVGYTPISPPGHYDVAWIDPSSGAVTRTVDLGQVGYGSIVASNGYIYFSESGYVAALNESSGALAWSADQTGTSIAVDGQTLYVGESPPDSLASFDATTGKAELKPKLDGSGAGPSLTVGDGRAWLTGGPSFVASSSTGAVIRGAGNTQLPALDGSLAATVDAAPRSNSFTLAAGAVSGVDDTCTPTVWSTPTTPTHIDGPVEGAASAISPEGTWTAGTYAIGDPNADVGVFRHSTTAFVPLASPSPPASIDGINDTGITTGRAVVGYGTEGVIGPSDGDLVYADNLIEPGQCDISAVGAINDDDQALAPAECETGPELLILSPPAGWTSSALWTTR